MGTSGEAVIVSSEQSPIAIKIRDALLAESRLGGAYLRINMQGNSAVVSGSIRTEDQRNLALNITGRYVGRDRVIDNIETGEQISYNVCEA